MKRGRYAHLAVLGGMLALTAGAVKPAHSAGLPTVPARIEAFPSPGAVLISFSSAFNAVGYNIYRHEVGQPAATAPVNTAVDTSTFFVDNGGGSGLPNGTHYLYSVKAVFSDAAGKLTEGAASNEVVATPQLPILGGLFAYDIGTTDPSTVTLDGNVLSVKASGMELWSADDHGTFLGTAISGDYSVSVALLDRPQGGHPSAAKAGPMIREGLVAGDRYAIMADLHGRGVVFEGRTNILGSDPTGGGGVNFNPAGTNVDDTKFPLFLKLTKAGAMISAFQGSDATNYTQVGDTKDYGVMQPVTYVGLGVSAVNTGDATIQYTTAKFDASTFKIE